MRPDICETSFFRTPGVITCVTLAVLILLAGGVYLYTTQGGFILDDYDVIVNQKKIGDPMNALWFFGHVDFVDTETLPSGAVWRNPYYRPVFFLTFLADHVFYGKDPHGYHRTNVLLHIAVTCLLFFCARSLSGSTAAAAAASAVYAVHPAHAEPVAWITARNHLLGGLFLLGMIMCYRFFLERKAAFLLASSVILFALALLSTEMAVMGIVLLALYGFLVHKERFRLSHVAPYLAVLALYFLARILVMGSAITSVRTLSLTERLLTAPHIMVRYLKDAILPVNIPVAYQLAPVSAYSDSRLFTALFVLCFLVVPLLIVLYRKNRVALFGVVWFLVSIFPVLNIVQEVQPFLMATRYLYIPSLGLALSAAVLCASSAATVRAVVFAAAVIVVVPLSVMAHRQAGNYLDDVKLKAIILPMDERHQTMLAGVSMKGGDFRRALSIAQEIVRKDPFSTEGYLILGDASRGMGEEDRAEEAYIAAIERGRQTAPKEHAYHALGVLYGSKGKYRESARMLEQALAIRPSSEAYQNLGLTYENLGMPREAQQAYARAAEFVRDRK